ncbi:hypothetical protein [Ethanoligenens harbinense]|uniref:Uncharacterized protein n=1 Tax=Ethanoligenens harbinense (strain DSM 18485 / JCM 12961 / CGMCC 1.5033 / YUAN-3) TaxID=663278 RepID=E6U5Q5_ETHHY|nr:hypothetical protein [Ethanoligenens harbinense]ADU26814.1 hypothetical protein Ethha_1271 [Ethanoligenens harbinense YUAN-3]AVQ95922.1 hypothetical protein CXQ68_06550 [Ethanoligenens harbinense YUAN-3]AYF38584.1 hypothetical protein CXP51_06420 [Ethanoligenens harbinense]AYF41330.1 hypothetical protein CN246_06555 [Ethanoligenens harbinense]QCN92163.1 hypothetical protein DRA42_06575 [Ethanoligenens harbinense]
MEALQVLDEICAKKDLSKDNRKKAVAILLTMSEEINNAKQVADYLMKLHYSVCPAYFNRAATELSNEQLATIVEEFRTNEQFQKDKPQNFLYPKGFGSVLSLTKASKYELAFSILNYILIRSESGSQFADGCKNNFKKTIVDVNGLSFVQKLYEVVNADAFKANPFEKQRFERFLDAVVDRTVSTTIDVSQPPAVKVAQAETAKEEEPVQTSSIKAEKTKNYDSQISKDALVKIESTQTEILLLLRRLTENRAAIDTLSMQIQKKNGEIATAQATIREREQQLSFSTLELKKIKTTLSSSEAQVSDLTERLRTSLNMDEISKNQELATLKNDISEALKLDYSDFMASKGSEYSSDLFEAYRSTLTRIFKLLKRFGITYE